MHKLRLKEGITIPFFILILTFEALYALFLSFRKVFLVLRYSWFYASSVYPCFIAFDSSSSSNSTSKPGLLNLSSLEIEPYRMRFQKGEIYPCCIVNQNCKYWNKTYKTIPAVELVKSIWSQSAGYLTNSQRTSTIDLP
jgi:hypothetical protein